MYVRTYGQTCAKTMIPTGRDFGLAEWINKIAVINDPLDHSHVVWPAVKICSAKFYLILKTVNLMAQAELSLK